jgi:hypothetical protein
MGNWPTGRYLHPGYLIQNQGARLGMTITKKILVADRVRRPPPEGFSWTDRRFLRDFAASLSGDAVFLYLLLAAVSDKHGLSFYSDTTLASRLRASEPTIVKSRRELLDADLIAFAAPLTQVLSLPDAAKRNRSTLF